jgi:hypothetical protein
MNHLHVFAMRTAAGAATLVLALWGQSAAAGPLQLLTDARSVQASGTATTDIIRTFYNGDPPTVTPDSATQALSPLVHPADSFGSFNGSDGMALRTAAATLDGQGFQQSQVDSDGVRFTGLADVLAVGDQFSVAQNDYLEETIARASGSTGSRLLVRFALDQRWSALLTMDSNLGGLQPAGFSFKLTGDNGFGWYDPYLIDDSGNQVFSFSTALSLAPGVYTLEAGLAASASADALPGQARRVSASFSLLAAPVPEPAAWLLFLGGLLAVGGVRAAQGRQCTSKPSATRAWYSRSSRPITTRLS